MSVNMKNLISMMGILLFVIGLCALPSLVTAVIYREVAAAISFVVLIALCLLIGLTVMKLFPPARIRVRARDGFLIVALCWLIASFISALPMVITGAIPSFVDAFFEMCSGYSTTGASILSDIEALPKSILFWRSFSHWLGGMGIIVFATAIIPSIGVEGMMIASRETPGPTLDKMTPHFSDTSRRLYLLYIIFTVILSILLMFGGMSLYDALIHSFSTVGTGGFSNYNNSVAHFASPYIYWVLTIFMILCGTNFNLFFVMIRRPRRALQDEEYRAYMGIIIAFTVMIAIDLLAVGGYHDPFRSLTDSAFQVASVITTTGFATTNFDVWPTFAKMLLFLLMMLGASSSSTGGGPKIVRILVSIKLIRRGISLKIHPRQVTTLKLNRGQITQEIATNIANFMFLYFATIFVGSLLIAVNGFDLVTTVSAVVTCVGNVGPGFNLVGPTMNFSQFSDFSKIVLSFLMIAGRLELFTVFMLFSPYYWNSNKA